jgi:hypothetical protein
VKGKGESRWYSLSLRISAHGVRREEGVFASRRGRRFLGLTSRPRGVVGVVRFVEDEAVVEFGQWNIDADFGHGEDGAVEKNVADPVAAGAGEDGRGDSVLFEDDVALDRGRGAVTLSW